MKDWDPEYQPVLQNFRVGQTIRSYSRTVTESDLVAFIGFTGMRMPIFIDREYAEQQGPYGARICPGFLTASVAGGMLESILGRNVPMSSLTWILNVLGPAPVTQDGWWLLRSDADYARAGSSSQVMGVWNSAGEKVAEQMQSVAVFG